MLTQELINTFISLSDVCRHEGLNVNGVGLQKAKHLCIGFNTSHFQKNGNKRKYPLITKICPICRNSFTTSQGHPHEKETCSHACANSHFRSREDNPNWKGGYDGITYKHICFSVHGHACWICNEPNIVAVHHMDGDHTNEDPTNLVPLCPTHHVYYHSKFRSLVLPTILEKLAAYKNKVW